MTETTQHTPGAMRAAQALVEPTSRIVKKRWTAQEIATIAKAEGGAP